jgi:hypothetical protein
VSNWTIGYGALLAALGVGGFVATGSQHKSALIPAGFGAAAIGLGLLGRGATLRRPALYGAALLGVLGVAGAARGLGKLPALIAGDEVERPAAVIAQSVMAGLSLLHVGVCVRAILKAR